MPSRFLLATGLLVALAGGCAAANGERAGACRADADCVPATCCHPTACTTAASAPRCDGIVCSRECRPATLDCGGRCVCRDGRCEAHLAP